MRGAAWLLVHGASAAAWQLDAVVSGPFDGTEATLVVRAREEQCDGW